MGSAAAGRTKGKGGGAAARRIAEAVRRAEGQLLGGTEVKGTGGSARRPSPPAASTTTARAVWLAAGVVTAPEHAAEAAQRGPGKRRRRGHRGGASAALAQAAANSMRARGNAAVYPAAFPQPDLPPALVRGRVGLAEALHRTIATRDGNDQAHAERDGETGLLLPAREVDTARLTPRRYPESHLNGRGVAIDSAFDELYERQEWLKREVGDVPGLSDARPVSASVQRAMGQAGSAKNLRVRLNGGKPR